MGKESAVYFESKLINVKRLRFHFNIALRRNLASPDPPPRSGPGEINGPQLCYSNSGQDESLDFQDSC